MKNKITVSSILLFTLFGCANSHRLNEQPTVVRQYFNKNHWLAGGKIAIRYPDCRRRSGCEEKAVSAGLEWEHQGKTENLILLDPLGREHMRIQYANAQVHIIEGKREKTVALSELVDKIGTPLPLDSLSDWLTTKRSSDQFIADGWKVTVSGWNGAFYPRMKLEQKQYYLYLVVKNIQSFQ